jgi:hypothetical protein
MKYFCLTILLAFPFFGIFAQAPDYSASINITWPKDPGCYSGSHRGRPIILNNTLCAENGSRLRGDHIYMLPSWSQCWNHNIDSNTWKDMRDKRYLNCVRLLFYQPPLKPEGDGALTISDAVKYGKDIVSIATHFGFYVIIDYHSGPGYDSTRVKNFFQAMCAEFADDENVIFQPQSEPVWAEHIPDAYGDTEKNFTVSIWKQIRDRAPKSPIIIWEFSKVEPGASTFKGVVDSRPAIDYSNTIVGWHAYHAGFDTSLVGNGFKRYYPVMMTEMTRCPPTYGDGDYGPEIAKLEAMGCSWITLGAFPYYDPHDPISTTIKETGVPAPSIPVAPADGSVEHSNAVQLSWQAALGATSYRLQVGSNASLSQVVVDQAGLTSLNASPSGLASGSAYYWRVAACNTAGSSAWSPVRSFTTGPDASIGKNLLNNSDFEAGTSAWTFYTNGTGSLQQTSPGYDDGQAISLVITQTGSNTQLYQSNIPLEANATYRLSFAAYSSSGNGMDIVLQQHGAPYANYGLNKQVALSTAWAQYSVEFATTLSGSVSDARLMFQFGSTAVSGDQYWFDSAVLEKVSATAVNPSDETPVGFSLQQNYPNPFNPVTRIQYTVGGTGEKGAGGSERGTRDVELRVFDALGRMVATLVHEQKQPGQYEVSFDGSGLSSGVYFYRLNTDAVTISKQMLLIK